LGLSARLPWDRSASGWTDTGSTLIMPDLLCKPPCLSLFTTAKL
jgi:hypothetical protein